MDSSRSSRQQLVSFQGDKMHSRIEPYKVDEGYSEGTRSRDGSVSPPRLDPRQGGNQIVQAPPDANLEVLMRDLTEYERGEIAYDLLRGLRASSIAMIFDRLWPLFHKDPLEAFPPEITSLVLSYLEPHDLLTISLVSRAWRDRVTDSNLWKNKFSVEGWALDGAEVARFEKTFDRPTSPHAHRQSAHQLSQLTSSAKQRVSPDESHWFGHFGAQLSWSQSEGYGPAKERTPSADQEMMDVGVKLPGSESPDRIPISQPDDSNYTSPVRRQRRPLIITSPPGYARINYHYIFKQKRRLEDNWDKGCYKNFQLPHRDAPHEAHEECVYTIQYQGDYLVSGSRDRTVRIWNLSSGRLLRKPLKGHVGSVLCLQFDSSPEEDIIVSGSSDTSVILWRFSTGEMIKRLSEAHKESVLNLRFDHRFLVTCSKDRTIKIWNRHQLRPGDTEYPVKGVSGGGNCPAYIIDAPTLGSPRYQPSNPSHLMNLDPYMHLMTLDLHGAAVNAIQIYKDQLVSASGDRNLRVWNIHTGECYTKIQAHEKGIACVQYDGKRIVSGSSDNSIRIWDPATKTEVARLEGHSRLVRTLQAAFADVPGGRETLEAEAAEIDRQWHVAREHGEDLRPGRAGRPARPGSRRPRDLRAIGAKIPPSGGGSRWARIISGSYDEKVIIWKKNGDDEWIISHQLAQEEALTAAGPPLFPRAQLNMTTQMDDTAAITAPVVPSGAGPSSSNFALPLNHTAPPTQPLHPPLSLTPLSPNPGMPSYESTPQYQINTPPGFQQPRSSLSTARNPHQMLTAQKSPSISPSPPQQTPSPETETSGQSTHHPPPPPAPFSATLPPDSLQPPRPPQPPPRPLLAPSILPTTHLPPPHPHPRPQTTLPVPPQHHTAHPALPPHPAGGQPNARVFKLQFDARRIVCCSQDNKIVGWDFANGDEDIIACSRFFADPT